MRRHLLLATVLILAAGSPAGAGARAGEAKFASKPQAVKKGGKVEITFAVSAPTDVEVAVLDAKGEIVRRLAAGVLGGKKPPPAPLVTGLSQSLEWDGNDDYGKKVAGGPFRIRVRAGLKPEFDGFLLYNPEACGPISALATGPKGNVYLFHHDAVVLPMHWGSKKIKIISRDGKHVRAITPFPADIAAEKIKALGPFKDKDGDLVPRVHHTLHLSFYPDAGNLLPPYSSPAVDSKGRVYWLVLGPALACVAADGGVPYPTFVGPRLLPGIKDLRMRNRYRYSLDTPTLAVSGDGKFIYFAGLWTGKMEKETFKPLPCVFRVDVATRSKAEVFLGKPGSAGKEKGQLTAPRGLAVANGLLYVADARADRIVVFKEADRSYVGEIKVKNPQSIGVDPATGAVYVCVYLSMKAAELLKFDGWENGRQLYKLGLPLTRQNPNLGIHRIAVDASKKPVRIWLPGIPRSQPPSALRYIEDAGDKFVDKGDPRGLKGKQWAEGPRDMSLDRKRGELYVKISHQKWFRLDEKTGKTVSMVDLGKIHKYRLYSSGRGTQMVVAPDGNMISLSWKEGLIYHDRTGKPINWPGRKTDRIPYGGLMNFSQRVLAVTPKKEIYVVLPNRYAMTKGQPAKTVTTKSRTHAVNVLDFDGNPKRTVIWSCTRGAVMKLDHKGNIYLAEPVRPVGRWYPKFFDGKLENPKHNLTPGDGKEVFWNSFMYGSIVKFPPSGGAIWYGKDVKDRKPSPGAVGKPPAELLAKPTIKTQAHIGSAVKVPAGIQGAEWYRFGFSPFLLHALSGTCNCEGAGFDIDLYGRVWYPNLGQFRVEVVDAANNMIGAFGKYGNMDSGGKDAKVKKPAIPLAWPLTVVASDTHAYVGDTVNRRVVKVKLGYAAEENCDVR